MKHPSRICSLFVVTFLFCISIFPLSAQSDYRESFDLAVRIRPGVIVPVKVTTLSNPRCRRNGKVVLSVHGLAHTGDTFKNYAQHLFDTPSLSAQVSKVVFFSLPGHGKSGNPIPTSRLLMGDLTLSDYVTTLFAVLDKLDQRSTEPTTIVAHSMGGIVVQMAQEELLARGKSLRRSYGITSAMLISPTFPREVPWYLSDSGTYAFLASQFLTSSPALGQYVEIPVEVWLSLFFTDLSSAFIPGTPTPEEVVAKRYISKEPWAAADQLGGVTMPRPSVRRGAFAAIRGTKLSFASLGQDSLGSFAEDQALYRYLTADTSDSSLFAVTSPLAVHDSYIAAPEILDAVSTYALSR